MKKSIISEVMRTMGRKGGKASMAKRTPEERRALAAMGGKASGNTRIKCTHLMTPAQMAKCLRCKNRLAQRKSREKRKS